MSMYRNGGRRVALGDAVVCFLLVLRMERA